VGDSDSFWNWQGQYVGYRSSGCLFGCDGLQLGYFAEGDEVYGCSGEYIGEVRSINRLITRLCKKAWTRRSVTPCRLRSTPGQCDTDAKAMLAGFEDFPAPMQHV
jgi:hypothetical protein